MYILDLGVIPSSDQDLLLALDPGITPVSTQATICCAGNRTRVSHAQGQLYPYTNSLAPIKEHFGECNSVLEHLPCMCSGSIPGTMKKKYKASKM